jgi:hypothetical protein
MKVIERWANCRCVCCRPPLMESPGCQCYKGWDGVWKVTFPVRDECDEPTPRDKKTNRKGRKNR